MRMEFTKGDIKPVLDLHAQLVGCEAGHEHIHFTHPARRRASLLAVTRDGCSVMSSSVSDVIVTGGVTPMAVPLAQLRRLVNQARKGDTMSLELAADGVPVFRRGRLSRIFKNADVPVPAHPAADAAIITGDAGDMALMVRSTAHAMASRYEVRPFLRGLQILADADAPSLAVTGMDGHRLARASVKAGLRAARSLDVIFPRDAVPALSAMLEAAGPGADWTLALSAEPSPDDRDGMRRAVMSAGGCTVSAPLVDADYPQVERIIDETMAAPSEGSFTADPADIVGALADLAGAMEKAASGEPVRCGIRIGEGEVSFSTKCGTSAGLDAQPAGPDAGDADGEGEPLGYNMKYLREAAGVLADAGAPAVRFELHGIGLGTSIVPQPLAPGIEYVELVMPLRH